MSGSLPGPHPETVAEPARASLAPATTTKPARKEGLSRDLCWVYIFRQVLDTREFEQQITLRNEQQGIAS